MKKSIDKLCCLFISQLFFTTPISSQLVTSTYDFESLTLGPIHGQDNWVVESSHSTVNNGNVCPPVQGTELGPIVNSTTNSGSYVGSKALSCVNWSFGSQHGYASRVNDLSWALPTFLGAEYLVVEFDFSGNLWGKSFFLGYDQNNDGNFSNGCSSVDANEQSFGLSTSEQNLRLHNASGAIVAVTTRPPEWCRYSVFVDVKANGGQGEISVCYRDLGNNGNWIPIQDFQGINAGFTPGGNNQSNPNNINGMAYDQEAGPTGTIDNISVSSINYDMYDTIICQGQNITIGQVIDGASYLWNNGSVTPTIDVSQAGIYSVTVTLEGCAQFVRQINVTEAGFSPNAGDNNIVASCNSENEVDLNNLLSVNTNGEWSEIAPVSGQFDLNTGVLAVGNCAPGMYQFLFVVNGQECPADTALIEVIVNNQPNAGKDSLLRSCNGATDQVILNDLLEVGATPNGLWTETSMMLSGQLNNGVFSANNLNSEVYTFNYIVEAPEPCVFDTAKVSIAVVEYPTVNFQPSTTVGCPPLAVNFLNLSTNLYNSSCFWNLGNVEVLDCGNVNTVYETGGNYDVSLMIINDDLCVSSIELADLIEVHEWPVASFTSTPQHIFIDEPHVDFNNVSTNTFSSYWNFGDGENSVEENPSHSFPFSEPGSYQVTLIVENEIGCADSTKNEIEVLDRLLFYVPNAFTPDANGHNDIYVPVMKAGFDPNDYSFQIFNRWGDLLFMTDTPNVGWDGKYKGRLVQDGVYSWKITIKNLYDNGKEDYFGHFSLFR
ncbi:MAG: PKD domain-containing protein [Flavobacteriales bacterium]|jgi:gliding motility-associated-like protein|nr:PKD domain-containing protein [Flavobacteriales bacterium]